MNSKQEVAQIEFSESEVSTSLWWAAHRQRYNTILLITALVSLTSLLLVWWIFEARLPCLEITGFSLVVGGSGFFVGLCLANLCYFLGPLTEWLIHPQNVLAFRRKVFALGTGFSQLLIFLPVVGNIIVATVGLASVDQCG